MLWPVESERLLTELMCSNWATGGERTLGDVNQRGSTLFDDLPYEKVSDLQRSRVWLDSSLCYNKM